MAVTGAFADTFVSSTMAIDLARSGAAGRKLAGLATDLFMIAVRMRDAEDLGQPAALRKLIAHYLKQFDVNCRVAGVSAKAVDDACYAIVALLDETVLSIPGACREFWLDKPLQLELYGEAVAGEEFYRRLDRLAADPQKNRDALEVYLLALALGFQGKYRLEGAEQRAALVTKIGEMLAQAVGTAGGRLSPHGRRFDAGLGRRRGPWAFAMRYGVALASAAVAAVTWAAVAWANATQASDAARVIQTLFGRQGP